MKRLPTVAGALLILLAAGCDRASAGKPPPEPDWLLVERLLGSDSREDRGEAVGILLVAEEDNPGTLARLAEIPSQGLPGLRHYTAAYLLVSLPHKWTPSKRTLELLIGGLEDERTLPVGGAADWDLPIGRFCQDAVELLTGEIPPARPINVMPSHTAVLRWRKWWEEGHDYLCLDADRGTWAVDPSAKRLCIPIGGP